MQAHEIRQKFLEFFAKHEHTIVPSSSLLPANDPTLLFTNAGMVQFKDVFTGQAERIYKRAVTCQKCVRAGGKHNDLENVGFTPRHHTFFEMLGNFSFGDYFKAEAMIFAWEFLTGVMKLDPKRLYVTIFRDDDEAEKLWRDRVGVPKDKISRHDEKDNFWAMGDTGPCGPCSEILYDQGAHIKEHDNRYLEIWNLVFMQYERSAKGELKPLPNPCIDTGMGLERLCAIHQGVDSNYDIDLMRTIIDHAADLAGKKYGSAKETDVSLRVIADHARATAFLMADQVIPGNEGAPYVLRRIMRRGIRHGKKLELDQPFLFEVVKKVIGVMSPAYPELINHQQFILGTTRREEERFAETLDKGLEILETEINKMGKGKGERKISGEIAFKLYDTYGFPVDLTQTIAEEKGLTVDLAGFERELGKQKGRSQEARKTSAKTSIEPQNLKLLNQIKKDVSETRFTGYDHVKGRAKVMKIFGENDLLKKIKSGDEASLLLDETPFYAEAGGQVGDTGVIRSNSGFEFEVTNTTKSAPQMILHHGVVRRGELKEGEVVATEIDATRRRSIILNHSATHLLHASLRMVLGKHVHQKGSLVAPERLRFDYTHHAATERGALKDIEDMMNEHVRLNHAVTTSVLPLQEALNTGAMALFGEKYGDQVRVVRMGEFSTELCGGTHVRATGEIGLIRLRGESGVSSGVRRLEALTGQEALNYVRGQQEEILKLSELLKTGPNIKEIEQKIQKLVAQQRDNRQKGPAQESAADFDKAVKEIKGVKIYSQIIDSIDPAEMRMLADRYKTRLQSGVVALGSVRDDKVSLIVVVSADLTSRLQAGKLIKEMVKHVNGSGGGRPDMAQAGGDLPAGLQKAMAQLEELI